MTKIETVCDKCDHPAIWLSEEKEPDDPTPPKILLWHLGGSKICLTFVDGKICPCAKAEAAPLPL